ncbi:hypothetical protein [Thalassovita sp.]|uniref:hypothetical protein n=1 Tax=Thalassovita sp. TaxID=1979401 RepID=UPI0029DE5618|nr:hypothetical protein [Thalassovita sp.]
MSTGWNADKNINDKKEEKNDDDLGNRVSLDYLVFPDVFITMNSFQAAMWKTCL